MTPWHWNDILFALCEGNHQPPVDSPQKEPVMQSFGIFLVVSTLLTTQSSGSVLPVILITAPLFGIFVA